VKKSEKFEKQIQRIHELVEQKGSKVTWNDRIPDPDNPSQPRQIDITIKRKNKLTIIECRIHGVKQNVKWVEEIIGRRISLKADAAIAVSASGFTKGALQKAKKYGIILRDLQTLTEEEIASWGHGTKVWLTFYQYKDTHLTFIFYKTAKNKITPNLILDAMRQEGRMYNIFEFTAKEIDDKNPQAKPCVLKVILNKFNFRIAEEVIRQVVLEAKFNSIKQVLNIPAVVAYDAPDINSDNRSVLIENVELGDFEITQSSNTVSAAIDLSAVKCPTNGQFRYVTFDFKRKVTMKSVEILAMPEMKIPMSGFRLSTGFV